MFRGIVPSAYGTSQSTPPYAGSYKRQRPPSDEELTQMMLDHIRNANYSLSFQALPHFANIRMLILERMNEVVTEIGKKTELQILNLQSLGLTASSITPFIDFMKTNPPILSLSLNGNELKDAGAAQIGELLAQNTVLANLSLSTCGIATEGFLRIANALKSNTTLTGLTYHNLQQMGPAAGATLTEIVAQNTTLTSLECSLRLQEPERLIDALLKNSTLTKALFAQYQTLGQEGFERLAEVIRTTTTLAKLTFNLANMPAEDFTEIAAALSCNSSLRSLELKSSLPLNPSAHGVIEILTNNTTLKRLDVSSTISQGTISYTLPEQTQILELYLNHPSLIRLGLNTQSFERGLANRKSNLYEMKRHNQEQRKITLMGSLLKNYLSFINKEKHLPYIRSDHTTSSQ